MFIIRNSYYSKNYIGICKSSNIYNHHTRIKMYRQATVFCDNTSSAEVMTLATVMTGDDVLRYGYDYTHILFY